MATPAKYPWIDFHYHRHEEMRSMFLRIGPLLITVVISFPV